MWTNLRTVAHGAAPYNLANKPLRILNFDVEGNFSTFCPELVAATSQKYGDFVMGNIMREGLADLATNPVFQQVHREIEEGLALCEQTCPYWNYCGGGEPSSKFFEHGRFDVAETTTCRISQTSNNRRIGGLPGKESGAGPAGSPVVRGTIRPNTPR